MRVDSSLSGARLLVTGITGFLGKVWLAMLLDRVPDVGHVTVIVRGRRGESARARFRRIAERSPAFRPLRARHGADLFDFLDARVTVLDGDVTRPSCGLDAETARREAARIDAVVHFAGLTDFEPDPVQAIAVNVLGGEHAADLAALSPSKRIVHVSTAFVAGNVSGRIPERVDVGISPIGAPFDAASELAALRAELGTLDSRSARIDAANRRAHALGWPNIYTFSKGLSEQLLAARTDVESVLVRPTVVESARSFPFVGWNEGINTSGPLVWLLASWFRKLPSRPQHRFDVVPVDTVARATTAIVAAALEGKAEPVYHLGSSDTNPMRFERAIELTALAARRMHSKPDAEPIARLVLKHLDAVARTAERDPFPSLPLLRRTARRAREWLKDLDVGEILPPSVYREHGPKLEERIRSLSMDCRNADRTIGRIEDMLRLYQPFIHDNDYVFETRNIRALTETLSESDRARFGFDIDTLDWRSYWLDVHVPGLEKWSLPLLRNERVPDDPPMMERSASAEGGSGDPADSVTAHAPTRIERAIAADMGAAE